MKDLENLQPVNMMNSYDATMTNGATTSVANAMFKVFVEGSTRSKSLFMRMKVEIENIK